MSTGLIVLIVVVVLILIALAVLLPRMRANKARRQTERELNTALLALVTDPVRRARLGAAARALVEANRGAKTKTLEVIGQLLPHGEGHGHGRSVVRPFRLVH